MQMEPKDRFWLILIIAIAEGMLIGWIDSRPNWDDTGITVGMILIGTFILGVVHPKHSWVWALSVGIWIPIWNIVLHNNYGSIIAIAFAMAGAYSGALIRKFSLR